MRFLAIFFLFATASGWEHSDWLKQAETRVDEEAITWLRKQINPEEKREDLPILITDSCKSCFKGEIVEIEEPKLLVFMSFSVPENIWLALAQEMPDYQGVFVLRGLPDSSFKSFAQKVAHLKEKGMGVSVQIHPQLFKDYAIDRVPAFVVRGSGETNKLVGTTSIAYACSLLSTHLEKKGQSSE